MSAPEKPLDLPSVFSLTIFWLNGLLMRNGERITKPDGQSSARWQILGRAAHGSMTVSDMARGLGLARQSVQRVANDLEGEGLVHFQPVEGDRRTFHVKITEKGASVLKSIYERNALWSEAMLRRLGADDFEATISLLRKIGGQIEEELENED